MKETKKAILEILKKKQTKKNSKFENLVLNLALQKIDSDSFEYDGEGVYTADGKNMIYCMSAANNFVVPDGVETIGEMAFRGKKLLKNVIIANSVTTISRDAFYDCDGLETVYIPSGVKEVKGYSFADCDNLKRVTFAGVPTKLSRHTFDECDKLHEILIPEGTEKAFRKALHYEESESNIILHEVKKDVKKETNTAEKNSNTNKNNNTTKAK